MKNKSIIILIIVIIVVSIGAIFTLKYLNNKKNTNEKPPHYYVYEVDKVLDNRVITTYADYLDIVNELNIKDDFCESIFFKNNNKVSNVIMYFIKTDTCGKNIYDLVNDSIADCTNPELHLYIKEPCCTGNEKNYVILTLSNNKNDDINSFNIIKHRLYNSCKKEN